MVLGLNLEGRKGIPSLYLSETEGANFWLLVLTDLNNRGLQANHCRAVIEAVHRQFRKLTKTKGAFPSENSLLKLLYMGILNASKKWTMPLQNWNLTLSQRSINFEGRLDDVLDIQAKPPATVFSYLQYHGGIQPRQRRRCLKSLSLEERKEISRGLAIGHSLRSIAGFLCRSPSTISREVNKNGGT